MTLVSSASSQLHASVPAPTCLRPGREGGVILVGIRWQTYLALVQDFGDRPIRLTYDRGNLEIMAPSFRHEVYAKILGRLVETLAEELELDFKSGRTTTFRREDLDRGLEADDCFYFKNVSAILGKTEIDLTRDPPPDLALEIDFSTSSINRMGIYAALGVSEVWRFEGQVLEVLSLAPNSAYQKSAQSPTFPGVPVERLTEFMHQATQLDDRKLLRLFREWVRKDVLPGYKAGN
jgi:Uma2 family endonuclease